MKMKGTAMATKTRDRNPEHRAQKGRPKQRKTVVKAGRAAGKEPAQLSVREVRQRFGVSRKIFSRVIGFSERAIADWEAKKPLSEACLQRVREVSRLQRALAGVMQEDYVGTWLNLPNDAFDGLKPIECIERGEIDRLWRMIYQLESGVPT
jgi:DNA-binding transcriptional regulator YiaG